MSNTPNLPVGNPDTFIGEAETMDLSELMDKIFLVGVAYGDAEQCKYIPESAHGPYGFYEMVEQVAHMWQRHQHHAKAVLLSKDPSVPPQFLDECTIDYIEANAGDIVAEGMLGGEPLIRDFTCRAGILDATVDNDDPRHKPDNTEEIND